MDSIDIEEKFDCSVVIDPEDASFIVDSVDGGVYRFSSWSEAGGCFHFNVKGKNSVITVRKYLHPSNRFYLVKSNGLDEMR